VSGPRRRIPHGLRALVLNVDPASGRTPKERLALNVRATANAAQRCLACGVDGEVHPTEMPGIFTLEFRHEHDCPAATGGDLRRWGRR
jgi:hypothetical protein